jgi:hypothetical protein
MWRYFGWGIVAFAGSVQVGCDQATVPPARDPGIEPGSAQIPAPPAPVTPPAPAIPLTMEAAGQARAARATRIVELLDTITDDASAAAAGPQFPALASDYAAAVKQFNATAAALSLSGQDEQVRQYVQKQPANGGAELQLIEKIERVVNSPQGPTVQPAINNLFDIWLQNASTGERRSLERLIDAKKLRR